MNTMKLWKGTNNIAWLIEALLSSFLFFLSSAALPPFLSLILLHQLLLLFFPIFLSFMLVLFLLLFLSLLALTHDYLTPSPPISLPSPTLNSFPLLSPTAPSLFQFSPHPLVFFSQPFHFPLQPSPLALLVLPVLCTTQSYCPPPGLY